MKTSRLAISSGVDNQSNTESFLNYILPNKEQIQDFYSDRDFTLIVSNSGEVWEIGNFLTPNENSFEYHSLSFRLSIASITSNGTCTLLLSTMGKVYGWGRSHSGILDPESCPSPVLIPWLTMKKLSQLSISQHYAGCIDDQGSAFIWGTFPALDLQKSVHQINDYKLFTCKELICKSKFFALCTDGGFVYYTGTLGSHSRNSNKDLFTFEELEQLCVLQIAAGEDFISILTESSEIFVFDGCSQLIKLPVHSKVDCIVANKEYIVGFSNGTIHKWLESGSTKKQLNRNVCPLRDWTGKVFVIDEKFKVCKLKAMNHLYGLIINCENFDRIEGNLVKSLEVETDKKGFRRSVEENGQVLGVFVGVVEKVKKKFLAFGFVRVYEEYYQKTKAEFVLGHSKLPYVLAEVMYKKFNKELIIGFSAIKEEIRVQDLIARERIKKIRACNKKKQENLDCLIRVLCAVQMRIGAGLCKSALFDLDYNRKCAERRQERVLSVLLGFRQRVIRHFWEVWSWKTRNYFVFVDKILVLWKNVRFRRMREGFAGIYSRAKFKMFILMKRKTQLTKIGKIFNYKQRRIGFNVWKTAYVKLKAQQEREFKKYQLSVKLGCKYLFPVIDYHLSTYWSIFQLNSFLQVKSRYKHFAQFLHYFLKKKLTGFWALSFLRISGTSASLTISPEDSQYSSTRHKEDPNLATSSLVSSLNTLINSHKKKVSSCMGSPIIPKLSLNDSSIRGKVSSSQSTFRPPWKPASNPNSRGNTPKADNKRQSFQACTNRCLRSLNILPAKKKIIQKKPNKASKTEGIRLEVGLGNMIRAVDNIKFRLKFKSFSIIKYC